MAHEFTDANFESTVMKSESLVVIDFWAVWCGPCKMIAPVIEELAGVYDGKVLIGKVDVDNNQEVSHQFKITSIPTLVFVKNGQEVGRHVGVISRQALTDKIEALS